MDKKEKKKEYDKLRYIENKKNPKTEYSYKNRLTYNEYKNMSKEEKKIRADNLKKEAQLKYNKTDKHKKRMDKWNDNNKDKNMIKHWKNRGLITDDWDNVYEIYMDTTNCNYCNKQFKNTLDRHLDHDHSIKDDNNIRGILCRVCNLSDVLKGCPAIF